MSRCLILAFVLSSGSCLLAADTAPISVSIVKPEKRDVTRWVRLPGSVDADAEVTLYAKVSGYLEDFQVDVGDIVKPGQVLGHLDAAELEEDVKTGEAQLAAAQTDLDAAIAQSERTQLRKEDIDARQLILEAEVEKAKADAARTEIEYERTKKLFSTNASTEQERDNSEYIWKMQAAAARAAQNRLDALKPERALWQKDVDVSKVAVEAARRKVSLAETSLGRARVWFGYTHLTVPQLGVHTGASAIITRRFVTNGDLVPGGTGARSGIQPIVTLQVIDPVRVTADIPESESVYIKRGTAVQVGFHALPSDKPIQAKVTRTSGSLWSATRTMRIEIDVPNPDGRIKPGMMANVEFAADSHKETWSVPTSAIRGLVMFTADSGKAKKIPVKIGFQDHGWTEVIDSDVSDSMLIIKDAQNIADGVLVEVEQ